MRVGHRLIELGLELPDDVRSATEFPEKVGERDARGIGSRNPAKTKYPAPALSKKWTAATISESPYTCPIASETISMSGIYSLEEDAYLYWRSRRSIGFSESPIFPAFMWARISYTRALTNWVDSMSTWMREKLGKLALPRP